MRSFVYLIIFVPCLVFGQYGGQKQANQEALYKTKDVLTTPSLRKKAIEESDAAKKADEQVRNIMGDSEGTEEVYGLSAGIFEKLVERTNGDPEKLQQLLMEAQSNPKKFYESLGVEHKNQIKKLGEKLERKPTSGSKRP